MKIWRFLYTRLERRIHVRNIKAEDQFFLVEKEKLNVLYHTLSRRKLGNIIHDTIINEKTPKKLFMKN